MSISRKPALAPTGQRDTLEQPDDRGREETISAGWISPELLAETQRVWSTVYGRDVSVAEATEILLNVKRLSKILVAYKNGSG